MRATDPLLLPPEAPTISDAQRARVLAAEASVASAPAGLVWARRTVERVTIGADVASLAVQLAEATSYDRGRSLLELSQQATKAAVLHQLAHHLTSPTFPSHGVEWVGHFLGLAERYVGVAAAREYRAAFEREQVHSEVADRVRRVRKSAIGVANKECGALTRLIVDDPPEDIVCQLLSVDRAGLLIRTVGGDLHVPNERLRYASHSLSE